MHETVIVAFSYCLSMYMIAVQTRPICRLIASSIKVNAYQIESGMAVPD